MESWVTSFWNKSREALSLEPTTNVSEWANAHRILASTDSAEPGRWQTSRTPYLRAIMDALSPSSPVERVVVMAGAQTGKTSAGLNWLGFIVHLAPGPVMCVQPTLDMAKRFSRQRLDPLFENSPMLKGLLKDPRSRDSGNAILSKEFPGGVMIITGANSPSGLMSMPVRYLFLDEVDAYPLDAKEKGDPVELAMARTETFVRRKVLMTSTPSLRGVSRIEAAYEETNQQKYFVPCVHCGHMADITWQRIVWPQGQPQAATMVCEECGGVHTDRDKPALLSGGEWRETVPEHANTRDAGFHINGLYSPWVPWGDVATYHTKVAKDPVRLQVFVNTKLAESWEDQAGEVVHPEPLMARREEWGDVVPEDVGILTAGVDVQDDRLEMQVVGWATDEESWVLDYRIFWGETSGLGVWRDLEGAIGRKYMSADGEEMGIEAVAIDTGGHVTQMAYDFCRPRLSRRIYGIKGRGGPGIPIWPKRASRVDGKHGKVTLFNVGVDSAKDMLFARLKVTEPGPGYIHFSSKTDAEYFRQLTNEKLVTSYRHGRPVRAWQPRFRGDRVEALDSYVYAMAAFHSLIASGMRVRNGRRGAAPVVMPMRPPPAPSWFGDDKKGWF